MRTEILWGSIAGLSSLLWILGEWALGFHTVYLEQYANASLAWGVAFIVCVLLGMLQKRNAVGLVYTRGVGIRTGLFVTTIAVGVKPIIWWLYAQVLNTSFFSTLIAYEVSMGNAKATQAELLYNWRTFMLLSMVGTLVLGVLSTLFISWFIKAKTMETPAHSGL